MGRPTTKDALLNKSEENFKKLFALINSLSPAQQEASFLFDDRDKNIRDVLVHLYEWHQLLLRFAETNRAGNKTNFLPEPYNWRTYPEMNIRFWEKHQQTPLSDAVTLLEKSHSDIMALINSFTNTELFTKQYFDWTGTTSLGSYCVSTTASHYDWAMAKIKKHKKSIG